MFEHQLAEVDRTFVAGNLSEAQRLGEDALRRGEVLSAYQKELLSIELAKIYLYQGNNEQAAAFTRKRLTSHLGPKDEAERLLLLALAQTGRQQFDDAWRALREAKDLQPEKELSVELSTVEGSVLLAQGNIEQARRCFSLSIDAAHSHGYSFQEVRAVLNLGVVALRQERYEEALQLFRRAATVSHSINANLLLEKSLGNLGRAYFSIGDTTRARETIAAAAMQARSLGATVDETNLLVNAGLVQFADNDMASAEKSFEKAALKADTIHNLELQLNIQAKLAYLYLRSKPEAAATHIVEMLRLARLQHDPAEEAEASLLEALLCVQRAQFAKAEAILLLLVRRPDAEASFQWEAQNALAAIYDNMKQQHTAEQWYERAIATFHKQRGTFRSIELELPYLENGNNLYMGYMEYLIRAGRTTKALTLLDTSRAETLAEGLRSPSAQVEKTLSPQAVAGRLGATILVYCLRQERSYLWAVTGKEQTFYTLPGSGTILPLVTRHNEAILGAKDLLGQKDASESAGRALYDVLVAPASELLPKDGGRVVLVADSALSRLNFETLIVPGIPAEGKAAHYWIEDVSVTNARSLRLLAAGTQPRHLQMQAEPKMLLIGDPVYTKSEYAPLPNAASEMAGIAGHFSTAERVVVARQEALPAAYEASRPGRFRFMHFVAHATASELSPLDSAVILSSKDTGAASGTNKLYASEILKQPLSAELVTLSSCYSSGTRNYTGEGVVGLAWAFLRAGAHSVIGALWDVSDVSTPKLMDTMYTRLLAGDAPDAALRAAKLEMLHSEGVFRKPVYWGAFQLYAGR